MSIAAARSPSPGPAARPCCGGLRRSADSSPFRPAASPPDSPQSSSVCKNSGRVSPRPLFAEKENDPRDAAGAARTHKVRSSGGCGIAKSFMAPTISAASKAVAPSPSPRKKILGERNNDPVPSSPCDLAHSSKPRGPHPPPPEAALGAPRRLRLSLDGATDPPAAAPVASRGSRHSFGGDDETERVENHHHHDDAASADAAAPYDPKTNYLSPRPRFLRYKPNPRVEMYRHNAGGSVRRLEDGFATESSSEEVDTTEDGVSEEEQEQTTLSSVPDDSIEEETSALAPVSEARADSAAPAVAGVLLSQPAPDSPLARVRTPSLRAGGVLTPEMEPAASPTRSRPKKKRSSLRFLLAPLALSLFVAAAFVCVPPPPGSPVVLNTLLSKVSDFISVQELHPVELAARLKQWSSSSLDLVTSYWKALASHQEQEVFGPYFSANLSAAASDIVEFDAGFYFGAALVSVEHELEEIQEVVSESDTEMTAEPAVEELANFGDAEVEAIDHAEMEWGAVSAVPSEMRDTPSVMEEANNFIDAEVQEFNAEMAEEVSGSSREEMTGSSGEGMGAFIENSDIPSQSASEPEQAEGMDEASLQKDVLTEDSEGDRAGGRDDQEVHHSQKLGSDMWPGYLDKISNPAATGAALAAIIVPAALASLYMWQKQARVASNESAEQVEHAGSLSGSGSSEGHAVKDSQFQNPVVEESERLGGSGASQYSSSLSSGLGRRRKAKGEDTSGLEPVVSRRDSTARSTASYGSFTKYEKIHAKKGNKEDEAMTPVRRSSRLRNVKSPEA